MTYTSDGDMKMYGNYTINRGKYNFTLQDIILKDFDIREGSKISFLGESLCCAALTSLHPIHSMQI